MEGQRGQPMVADEPAGERVVVVHRHHIQRTGNLDQQDLAPVTVTVAEPGYRALAAATRKDLWAFLPRLLFMGLGFVPIASLCIALFGLVPLHLSALFVVIPAMVAALILGYSYPRLGQAALAGLVAGMIATGIYDCFRLALHAMGFWGDFIPVIGRMALHNDGAGWIWGYIWRFVGNGGCMGITFAMLLGAWRELAPAVRRASNGSDWSAVLLRLAIVPRPAPLMGMAYGAAICCCLFVTLLFAPSAQQSLFHLTLFTGAGAMIGHLIYGATLGYLAARWLPRS